MYLSYLRTNASEEEHFHRSYKGNADNVYITGNMLGAVFNNCEQMAKLTVEYAETE